MGSRIKIEGDRATVRLVGEVDSIAAPEVRTAVLGALDDGATSVAFDCSELTFIDSAGLSVLIEAHQQAQLRWGGVTVRRPSPTLLRMLEITGLDKELTIELR